MDPALADAITGLPRQAWITPEARGAPLRGPRGSATSLPRASYLAIVRDRHVGEAAAARVGPASRPTRRGWAGVSVGQSLASVVATLSLCAREAHLVRRCTGSPIGLRAV